MAINFPNNTSHTPWVEYGDAQSTAWRIYPGTTGTAKKLVTKYKTGTEIGADNLDGWFRTPVSVNATEVPYIWGSTFQARFGNSWKGPRLKTFLGPQINNSNRAPYDPADIIPSHSDINFWYYDTNDRNNKNNGLQALGYGFLLSIPANYNIVSELAGDIYSGNVTYNNVKIAGLGTVSMFAYCWWSRNSIIKLAERLYFIGYYLLDENMFKFCYNLDSSHSLTNNSRACLCDENPFGAGDDAFMQWMGARLIDTTPVSPPANPPPTDPPTNDGTGNDHGTASNDSGSTNSSSTASLSDTELTELLNAASTIVGRPLSTKSEALTALKEIASFYGNATISLPENQTIINRLARIKNRLTSSGNAGGNVQGWLNIIEATIGDIETKL